MAIPNYLMALANHQGPAKIYAGGMVIPVKIGNIDHESDPSRGVDKCAFECLVVNQDQIRVDKLNGFTAESTRTAKEILNAVYGAKALANAMNPSTARTRDPFAIKKVIFSDPATIVIWADGTKTIVKCQEGDVYSKETGLALCIAKKALGNKGSFNDVFHKWIPEEEEIVEVNVPADKAIGEALAKITDAAVKAGRAIKGGIV